MLNTLHVTLRSSNSRRYCGGKACVLVLLVLAWFLYSSSEIFSVLLKNLLVNFIILTNTSTIARGKMFIFTCKRVVCFN